MEMESRIPETGRLGDVPGPDVSVIPATKRFMQGEQFRGQEKLRVAAYCRVSTGDESQQTSYTNQRAFYSEVIRSRPGWSFAGIYADEARSGTNRIYRKEFNRMIEDAKAGKIDYIITKSISRFARNTVDTLECVRQLKQLSPPVGIVFEKENIDTLNAAGELILTILSALAQDESRSLSDNIRWTFQKNFQAGKPQINLNRMLGYDKGENGEWIINEKQAKVVRFIFEKYVRGHSANAIARQANEAGMRTVNGKLWRADSVLDILRNEKYVGDLEMQKTITKDFLTHRSSINRGEAPKYYVKDHHEGIVDRFTWDKVRLILDSRKRNREKPAGNGAAVSPFVNLVCGASFDEGGYTDGDKGSFFRLTYCGTVTDYCDGRSEGFDPKTETETYSFQYPVWRCRKKKGGECGITDRCRGCSLAPVQECALEQSFMEMLYALKRDYVARGEESYLAKEFKRACGMADRYLAKSSSSVYRRELLDSRIEELEQDYRKDISRRPQTESDISAEKQDALEHYKKERVVLEAEQEASAAMKRNYDFFLRCLLKLPETNYAGMKINVNRLDVDGSIFRDRDGREMNSAPDAVNADGKLITSEIIERAPDYLRFERGMYAAFIRSGKVYGDTVEYVTNFGVRLLSVGNDRTLSSFLGFKRCREDGTVEFLDKVWKVNGKSVSYRRKALKRAKT